jgi:hypothetical protein
MLPNPGKMLRQTSPSPALSNRRERGTTGDTQRLKAVEMAAAEGTKW